MRCSDISYGILPPAKSDFALPTICPCLRAVVKGHVFGGVVPGRIPNTSILLRHQWIVGSILWLFGFLSTCCTAGGSGLVQKEWWCLHVLIVSLGPVRCCQNSSSQQRAQMILKSSKKRTRWQRPATKTGKETHALTPAHAHM